MMKAQLKCSRCPNTDNLQKHHVVRGDDSSKILLCPECHSKQHPYVPEALFFALKGSHKSKSKCNRNLNLTRFYESGRYTLRALARMFHISSGRAFQIVQKRESERLATGG